MDKINWKQKLSSRKFWISCSAFLGSIAASIAGLSTNNSTVTTIGIVAGVLSAAIYSFCESWCDVERAKYTEEDAKEE